MTTGSGECSIRIGNNNKIAVVDLAGGHANCAVYITPTSVKRERADRDALIRAEQRNVSNTELAKT